MRGAFALQDAAVSAEVLQQAASLHFTITVSRSASGGTPRKPSSRRSLRFPSMVSLIVEKLGGTVNVLHDDMPQYAAALGAAVLARRRAFANPSSRPDVLARGTTWSSAAPS